MPIFDYICPSCGQAFDALVSLSEVTVDQSCPTCNVLSPKTLSVFGIGAENTPERRAAEKKAERKAELAWPKKGPKPNVVLKKPPPVPKRYMDHVLKHGHC
jgi:putative FmdB family regulatory protein